MNVSGGGDSNHKKLYCWSYLELEGVDSPEASYFYMDINKSPLSGPLEIIPEPTPEPIPEPTPEPTPEPIPEPDISSEEFASKDAFFNKMNISNRFNRGQYQIDGLERVSDSLFYLVGVFAYERHTRLYEIERVPQRDVIL